MSYKTLKKLLIWERKQIKKIASQFPPATKMAETEELESVPSILLPCTSCNRTFRSEALAKHIKVCEKSLMKKRKKFDSSKQRIQGTDLAQFLPAVTNNRKTTPSPKRESQSKWKEKHNQLVKAMRHSKPGNQDMFNTKPSDHEQCLYCERFFGPKAFDRHTEWCKQQQLKVQVKSQTVLKAKERLQARTKYRAPSFRTQRSITKEKFSPGKQSSSSGTYTSEESFKIKIGSGAFTVSNEPKVEPTVVNTKQNSPSFPHRRRTSSYSSVTSDQKSQSSSQSEMENDDSKTKNVRSETRRKGNLNDSNINNKREINKYDPFVSAELQMMELLKSTDEENKTKDTLDVEKNPEKLLSLSTLSLCSTVSIDSSDLNLNPKKLDRSNSAMEGKQSRMRKLNMHNLLYGDVDYNKNSNLVNCEAELVESMLEFEKLINECSNLDSSESTLPPNIDSAYSSLNRPSPGGIGDAESGARFCHECGGRYPVPAAKFCCQCGVRRLTV